MISAYNICSDFDILDLHVFMNEAIFLSFFFPKGIKWSLVKVCLAFVLLLMHE